jgi:hypothetical protein
MEIRKYVSSDGKWFWYEDSETRIEHGLWNDYYDECGNVFHPYNVGVGYYYKGKMKGFWVREF